MLVPVRACPRSWRKTGFCDILFHFYRFHIPRTKLIAAQVNALAGEDLQWFAAFGPHTDPKNWFDDQNGRDIILNEFRKTIRHYGRDPLSCENYKKSEAN